MWRIRFKRINANDREFTDSIPNKIHGLSTKGHEYNEDGRNGATGMDEFRSAGCDAPFV
jgi:hypothetical protein